MNDYDSQAKVFKALSHPARLAILDILREGEECVCHLEAALGCRQAYTSQQLMVLRDAGLVADRRDGWNIFYRVTKPEVFEIIDTARGAVDHRRPAPRADKLNNCPCPHCNPESEKVMCSTPDHS